ncbi:GNAT family N-acetyltransferase [Derxia gummosa]|uniref:GNAT family N-acetyltransferase n=1 Tax=Derxia gummosa DSM 723 TaxID=1121388 RepID=A0A9U5C6J4_9BURK|nr:GNAT family protein [Derxia gummosa]
MLYDSLPISDHELVELRPIVRSDIDRWYAYLSQPCVFEHTSWDLNSPEDLASHVLPLDGTSPEAMFRLAVSERASGLLVGTIGFHSVWPPDRRAELAYDLAPEIWGKGIGTHLVRLMVKWAHEHAGIARVQATVMPSNARSIAVLRNCGFEYEGLLRSYRVVRGRPGDFGMYSHIAGEP